jgi:hypothetical protein
MRSAHQHHVVAPFPVDEQRASAARGSSRVRRRRSPPQSTTSDAELERRDDTLGFRSEEQHDSDRRLLDSS